MMLQNLKNNLLECGIPLFFVWLFHFGGSGHASQTQLQIQGACNMQGVEND